MRPLQAAMHGKPFYAEQTEFCANLRMLCGYYRSVADVCRKLNINRAQFNRYLNGTSTPSNHTLERICDFFGVEPAEIYLPRDHFHQIVQVRPRQRAEHAAYAEHITRLQRHSIGKYEKYLGYYYEYYYSMSAPGKVLRGLVHVFMQDGAVYHERLERFPQHANLDEAYKCKYIGGAFYLNDRIFLVDYESLTGNEIAQTILFPTYRNKVVRLSGLMLGVSSSNQRSIACARVVFEYLGKTVDLRKAMRLCGLFDPKDGAIDATILKVIDNSPQKDQNHFYTIPL
ncbi:MAG TPA: helix-turn-helix transcriptional regulator [Noviherbaspirillum sp.]|jgi:transcriptional regulator with XRE-family HTH domain|uniref:helix-turn-helix domain-containing protein n=1 Tax=Noviherbaspirillum sp. TaxID=1926288 RepID=UPI002DDCA880|nr:helix-turn-helix transcriptional regulator [Noviherbaspirillum sp.]HEV2608821.1 helix-turn-helix transcriptional regulator [Noviherbaspirillum sp.]